MQMSYSYSSDLLFLNFCKLANEQKQQETIKTGFGYDKALFGKLTN